MKIAMRQLGERSILLSGVSRLQNKMVKDVNEKSSTLRMRWLN